ncbi:MAG: hypothetical protein HYV28_03105 [Ignavibacteriales bacterium]|nr:hypothetical protein [Ignavibacteriales bacterium]
MNRMDTASTIIVKNSRFYNLRTYGNALATNITSIRAIEFNPGNAANPTATVYCYNNFVGELSAANSTASPSIQAISVNASNAATALTAKLYYNTVYLSNSIPPALNGTVGGHSSSCVWWGNYGNASASLELKNNVFVNNLGNSQKDTNSSRATVLFATSNANLLKLTATSDNNLYYIDNPTHTVSGTVSKNLRLVAYDGTWNKDLSTLELLQASASYAPRDANSASEAVNFVATNDGHLAAASYGQAALAGNPISGYTTDVDGDLRSASYPYKGIDEITGPSATFYPTLGITALLQGFTSSSTGKMIPDTMYIALRSSTPPYSVVEEQAVKTDSNGYASIKFPTLANGTPYYMALRHRNSIETWSAAASPFTNFMLNYNFTTAASKAFGDNQVLVGTKYCLYGGDVNQDQFVDFTDLTLIDNDSYNFTSGYVVTDVNGDEFVDFSDLTLCDNNSYNFIGSVLPALPKAIGKRTLRPVQVKLNSK